MIDLTRRYQITSGYGYRIAPEQGASTNHDGIDLAIPQGTPLQAVTSGTVCDVNRAMGGYGGYAAIQGDDGYYYFYAHLSGYKAQSGQRINEGDIIAYSGGAKGLVSSGTSTGPHLHFGVHKGSYFNKANSINPLDRLQGGTTPALTAAENVPPIAGTANATLPRQVQKAKKGEESKFWQFNNTNFKLTVAGTDFTDKITQLSWYGAYLSCMRSLRFTMVFDKQLYMPRIGDKVTLDSDNGNIFTGKVSFQAAKGSNKNIQVTASDDGILLANNCVLGQYEGRPADIVNTVCAELGISVGHIDEGLGSANIIVTSTGNLTGFEVIRRAYARQSTQKYVFFFDENSFQVYKLGDVQEKKQIVIQALDTRANVMDIDVSSNAQNIVNKVMVIDDTYNLLETLEIDDGKELGTFQRYYKKKNEDDTEQNPQNVLRRIQDSLSITAVGNLSFVTGKTVNTYDGIFGYKGSFAIISDEHIFNNDSYVMRLGLYLHDELIPSLEPNDKPEGT